VSARVQRSLSAEQKAHDPLLHARRTLLLRVLLLGLAAAAGVAAHAFVIALALGMSALRADVRRVEAQREKIELHLVEGEAAPPPAVPDAGVTRRMAQPEPERTKPPEEPIDEPPTLVPEAPENVAPRRIVGLSLESTVGGGGGPAFAVGNTRMGKTAQRAADPAAVEVLPPAQSNRASARAQTGTAFVAPKKRAAVAPEYPPTLKAQGIEGDVVLELSIDEIGDVRAVRLVKSSGHPELDAAATKASAAERWSPATRCGDPVSDVITFTVRFRLTEG
jgi:protein TonB